MCECISSLLYGVSQPPLTLSVGNVCASVRHGVPLVCTWQELDRAATSASVVHAADLMMLRSLE